MKYCPMPSTWLNNHRWEDAIQEYRHPITGERRAEDYHPGPDDIVI